MSIISFIVRRLFLMVVVLFVVLTLSFFLSRLMPGDPVLQMLSLEGIARPSPEVYAAMRMQLGLDQPIVVQYFRYLYELFSGNWGVSISVSRNQSVWKLIMERLPRTVDIAIFSIVIASYLGIKMGTISATHRNQIVDVVVRSFALIGVSIPVFFLGLLLQYFFGYVIPIFPATGYKNLIYEDPPYISGFYIFDALISGQIHKIIDYLYHLIIPVACLSFILLAGIVRQTRSSMLEVLEQDYIRTARAKGMKEKHVIKFHALRNAMIPTATIIGLNFAALLTGAVLIESTFSLVGLGDLIIDSIKAHDYWLINAIVFLITIIYVSINLVTDLVYAFLDPRIRLGTKVRGVI